MLALDDPSINECKKDALFNLFDKIFIIFYTFEAVFKILGSGLFFSKHAYLRDSWNILDFVIVVSAWLSNPWID